MLTLRLKKKKKTNVVIRHRFFDWDVEWVKEGGCNSLRRNLFIIY